MNHRPDSAIAEIKRRASILDIVEESGQAVERRRSGKAVGVARCPFHDDRTPSLHFYEENEGGSFYCFGCGKGGDVFDFLRELRSQSFAEVRDWLAQRYQIRLAQRSGAAERATPNPLVWVWELLKQTSSSGAPRDARDAWIRQRGLPPDLVETTAIYYARGDTILSAASKQPRELVEALADAGLLYRDAPRGSGHPGLAGTAWRSVRDVFRRDRVVFPLTDLDGVLLGFAGRAVLKDDVPKYLFTRGTPTRSILYGADLVAGDLRVRRRKTREVKGLDLYVVEGIVDALRLRSLGLRAVAALGARLSAEQVAIIGKLAKAADRLGARLRVRLFFDRDEAGARATTRTLPVLLRAGGAVGFDVQAVLPPPEDPAIGKDPDEILGGLVRAAAPDSANAAARLDDWATDPYQALLALELSIPPGDLDVVWTTIPAGRRARVLRDVERSLPGGGWGNVLARMPGGVAGEVWWRDLERFLVAGGPAQVEGTPPTVSPSPTSIDNRQDLLHALDLAQASTQRREFPIDHGSWERLRVGADAFRHVFAEWLGGAASVRRQPTIEPYVAVVIPKADGRPRYKASPCPEDLVCQQYVLDAVLDDYARLDPCLARVADAVPAVRFEPSLPRDRRLVTTGPRACVPLDGDGRPETVSFAYQVRMDVVRRQQGPGREGIFRPYMECWRDFLGYIANRAARLPGDALHVARLDIRGFYDNLERQAVTRVLLPGLREGLKALATAGALGRCAPLLAPAMLDQGPKTLDEWCDLRARFLVDWLCNQCFGFRTYSPKNGEVEETRSALRGIAQGPDLSAYLANIALFPLDRRVHSEVLRLDALASERVAQPSLFGDAGAVYARYVDDMILVAPSMELLDRLRRIVADELRACGLELGTKTEPDVRMRPGEFRAWLTDRRGAALAASGLSAEAEPDVAFERLGALADAGDIDRGDALRVLHGPDQEDPDIPANEIEEALRAALSVADLRYGEFVATARVIWRLVALCLADADDGARPAELALRAVAEFQATWTRVRPAPLYRVPSDAPDDRRELGAEVQVHVALEGLERFLGRRSEFSPRLAPAGRESWAAARKRMARLVRNGELAEQLGLGAEGAGGVQFHHMIYLRVCAIRWCAAQILRQEGEHHPLDRRAGQCDYRAAWRSEISLAEAEGPARLAYASAQAGNERAGFDILHAGIARLRVDATWDNRERDPLLPEALPANVPGTAGRIRDLWVANPDGDSSPRSEPEAGDELCRDALRTFVNVAGQRAVALLPKRRNLLLLGIGDTLREVERFWPTPPGTDLPGFLALGIGAPGKYYRFVPCTEGGAASPFRPEEWTWTPLPVGDDLRICAETAEPPVGLGPVEFTPADPPLLRRLAGWFEGLVAFARYVEDDASCEECVVVPTADNLLVPPGAAPPGPTILGYLTQREAVAGRAFVRIGDGALAAIAVPADRDHLWRIGTALADALRRAQWTEFSEAIRLQPAALQVNEGGGWIDEAMLRFSLARLRGAQWRALSVGAGSPKEMPPGLQRLLGRLRNFPDAGQPSLRLAYLLETTAWSRAQAARHDLALDLARPGAATAFLAAAAPSLFFVDEQLASALPEPSPTAGAAGPRRRGALAWYRLGLRIKALLDELPTKDIELAPLVASCFLRAYVEELRAAVLERAASADLRRADDPIGTPAKPIVEARSISAAPAIGTLSNGALLALDQTEDDLAFSLRVVVDAVADAGEQRGASGSLGRVAPLGWLALLGVVTDLAGAGDVLKCGRRWMPPPGLHDDLAMRFAEAIDALAAGDGAISPHTGPADRRFVPRWQEDPFHETYRAVARWSNPTQVEAAFAFLAALDEGQGLQVHHRLGAMEVRREASASLSFRAANGTNHRLLSYQVISSGLGNDNGREQHAVTTPEGTRLFQGWSETWNGEHLVGISIAKRGLAHFAHMGESGADAERPPVEGASGVPTSVPVRVTRPAIGVPDEGLPGPVPGATAPEPPVGATETTEGGDGPQRRLAHGSVHGDAESLSHRFEEHQRSSWRARRLRTANVHVRVALLQWAAGDSYRHPIYDICEDLQEEVRKSVPKDVWRWPDGTPPHERLRSSRTEHRRQRILSEVLRACGAFGVDVLVLPEYTVRPDTIEWLLQTMPTVPEATGLSIWAGTFRHHAGIHPRFLDAGVKLGHAVLSVILPDPKLPGQWRAHWRGKKYPSLAVSECFRPDESLLPREWDTFHEARATSWVRDLICSECFFLSSPATHIALARAAQLLLQRFGPMATPPPVFSDIIRQDYDRVAKVFSIAENRVPPSILLVPAMTGRVQDFQVLGQASYFAAGLTTVFCNAVNNGYGTGRSCFIGAECWDHEAKLNPGLATSDPYHGVAPGWFRAWHPDRGQLASGEQALVIADIDPVRALGGRTQPQALPEPLRIVAHLPVIEFWEGEQWSKEMAGEEPWRAAAEDRSASQRDVRLALEAIVAVLDQAVGSRSLTTAVPGQSTELPSALDKLAELVGDRLGKGTPWLKRRAEAFKRFHRDNPQPWPPPCAVDWLPVALGNWSNHNEWPMIEVPPYGDVGGEPPDRPDVTEGPETNRS